MPEITQEQLDHFEKLEEQARKIAVAYIRMDVEQGDLPSPGWDGIHVISFMLYPEFFDDGKVQ